MRQIGLWDLLCNRAFRTYFVARAVTVFGGSLAPVAITFAVLKSEGGAALGLTLAAQTLPQLVMALVGGVVADRLERMRVLVTTNVVMFLCQATVAVALFLDQSSLTLLLTTQAVFGAARAFSSPASTGVVKELVPAAELQRANSLISMSRDTLLIFGPIVGGVLVALTSSWVAVLVNAMAFAVAGVFLVFLARLRLRRSLVRPETTFLVDLRDGWDEFRSRRWVWTMVAGAMVYQATVLPAIFVLGPVLALRNGLGVGGWAIVLGAQAAGAVTGGLVVMVWTPSRPLLLANVLVGLESAFLVALALDANALVVVTLAAVGTAGVIASDTLWLTTLQREIDEHMISRVSSYDWLGSLALAPVGFAVMGVASDAVDLVAVLVGIAVLNLVVRAVLMVVPDFWTLRSVASRTA